MSISGIRPVGTNPVASSLPFRVGLPGEPTPVHTPAGIEIRRRILRNCGVEVLDSDVKFSGAELLVIEKILKDVKKKKRNHLVGVKEIVKNKEIKLRLLKSIMVHAGGAYVAEQKRVYLFDDLSQDQISEVLIHEIGHAVNYFNVSFEKFMDFIINSGWNMTEMRRVFFSGNDLYQFGTKKIAVPADKWGSVWPRFSLNSLAKEQDVFGEILIDLPNKTKLPWDKNPLEKFA